MLLHTFYICHTIHIESEFGFSQKFKSGFGKYSRICAHLCNLWRNCDKTLTFNVNLMLGVNRISRAILSTWNWLTINDHSIISRLHYHTGIAEIHKSCRNSFVSLLPLIRTFCSEYMFSSGLPTSMGRMLDPNESYTNNIKCFLMDSGHYNALQVESQIEVCQLALPYLIV